MIVLDTHAWLWWRSAPDRLGSGARQAIDSADAIGVCSISCWEVAMLVRRGRIALDRDVGAWIRQALGHARVRGLELESTIAVQAALLADTFPGDPADRFIYATSRSMRAALVTRDERISAFDAAGTVW